MLTPEPFKRVRLGHVLFHAATEAETVSRIANALGSQRGGTIVTVNLDHLLRCKRFREYRAIVKRADLVVADGQPIIWASRIQGSPLPERMAGSSLCLSLASRLALEHRSICDLQGDTWWMGFRLPCTCWVRVRFGECEVWVRGGKSDGFKT